MIVCDDDATSELKVKTVQYFRYTKHTAAPTEHCCKLKTTVDLMIVTVVALARCCVLAVCGYTRLLGDDLERHLSASDLLLQRA